MKQLYYTTSTTDITDFSISILEDFGWIEPVFLLLSSNLAKVLRLNEEPIFLPKINHFEIISFEDSYALRFFDSENTIIKANSSELKIIKADHLCRGKAKNCKLYSTFEASYHFKEVLNYQEYCFFFVADGSSYLTSFTAFAIEDY